MIIEWLTSLHEIADIYGYNYGQFFIILINKFILIHKFIISNNNYSSSLRRNPIEDQAISGFSGLKSVPE